MTPERYRQIGELYHAALEEDAAERASFLERACAGDEELRREVESLISSHERAEDFIATPALAVAAELLAGDEAGALAGRTIARYRVLSLVGAGGMGRVYLAEDTTLSRRVALKLLPEYSTGDKTQVLRFHQEARAASALNHPNILTVYEVGRAGGTEFIAAEYVEGETLRERLARGRPGVGEALDVAVQIAEALAAAHAAGIVHRDIKPENVMLRADGYVKVLDFGLAKLTENLAGFGAVESARPAGSAIRTNPGMVMGTAQYMSPEQARGLGVDSRTDVWSLGVVLYEMVTGRGPFEGKTNSDVVAAVLGREPVPLARHSGDAPAELEWIIRKALTKDCEGRYQTARELLTDLKNLKRRLEFEAELERSAPPELKRTAVTTETREVHPAVETARGPASSLTRGGGRVTSALERRWRLAALSLAVFAALAALVGYFYFKRKPPPLSDKDTVLLADFDNRTGDDVFDGALKQALAIQFEQSPFLNIFPEERVRETLRFMDRSPNERVTKDLAREVCLRQGLKAYLAGSISNLGSRLVITLEAVNVQTGDTLAREQAEAGSKEQVLSVLGQAATRMREKLGESLASIQKFDAPIEQATTPSLEALKAYSLGREQGLKRNDFEAVSFFKRAAELDPNFALAYARLGVVYFNLQEYDLAAQSSEKAFELRGRTSDREKFVITSTYYGFVLWDWEKHAEVLEMWRRTYPRDYVPYNNLAIYYYAYGQYEKAIEELRESARLNPDNSSAYSNLALCFMSLDRYDDAKAVIEQARVRKLDVGNFHHYLYSMAFLEGDAAAMQQQIDWAAGTPNETAMLVLQAATAGYAGRLRRARELSGRAVELAERRILKEGAAQYASGDALREATFGNCREAREAAARALSLARGRVTLNVSALALALCGETNQAQLLADESAKRFSQDTYVNASWLPMIRAAIEINRNNPAQAIQLLQAPRRIETGTVAYLMPAYIRGLAYLRGRAGNEAAREFQKILDRKGLMAPKVFQPITYSLYPLAHLGLARAAALAGDTAKSRQAYQDFFALWREADADIPILQKAKREYEKLK